MEQELQNLGSARKQNAEQAKQSYEQAIAAISNQEFLSDEATFLPDEELALGGSSRPINLNPSRPVVMKSPKAAGATVKMKLKGKGQGISIDSVYLEEAFLDVDFAEIGHGQQLGLILGNGSVIYGWSIVAKSRRCMYIPKRLTPTGFPVPSLHRAKPVVVINLIIG